MTIAELIPLVVTISIFLNVLALGLEADLRDATYLFRRPVLLVRAILSMNVLMVIVVGAAATVFNLTFPVKVALLALAVSPIPPLLPAKEQKLGASESYAVGLLVAAVLLSLIIIPWSIEWIGLYFGRDTQVSAASIAPTVFLTAIIPLCLGIAVHRLLPDLAARIVRPVYLLSLVLLAAGILPIIVMMSGAIWKTIVDGSILALICFTVIGLVIGHLLGGPDPDNRTALALATSSRHPGVALAIATINFPDQKVPIMAVIICHLVITTIIAVPYNQWRKKQHAAVRGKLSSGLPHKE